MRCVLTVFRLFFAPDDACIRKMENAMFVDLGQGSLCLCVCLRRDFEKREGCINISFRLRAYVADVQWSLCACAHEGIINSLSRADSLLNCFYYISAMGFSTMLPKYVHFMRVFCKYRRASFDV